MRLLITGGCGLIGSALAERALREGCFVTVLDNLSTGRREHLPDDPRVELIPGNVCDDAVVGALVCRADAVAHLAASVGVDLILARPTISLRQSLLGTETVLRHAAAARCPVFFASTSEVYGDSDGTPLREDEPLGFGSPDRIRFTYAAGKAAGEALAFAYAREYGLAVVVGRFFNVTGPRQSAAVVPRFFAQARAGGPITVHGDGSQTRSFLDVRDGAEYVWRLLGRRDLLVNIGRDEPVTILDLAGRVRERVDPSVEVRCVAPDYRSGFVPIHHRRPDVTRLRETVDYAPRYELDAMLRAFDAAPSLP